MKHSKTIEILGTVLTVYEPTFKQMQTAQDLTDIERPAYLVSQCVYRDGKRLFSDLEDAKENGGFNFLLTLAGEVCDLGGLLKKNSPPDPNSSIGSVAS